MRKYSNTLFLGLIIGVKKLPCRSTGQFAFKQVGENQFINTKA